MEHEVAFAQQSFEAGMPLLHRVDKEIAVDIALFSRGGQEILRAIRQSGLRCAAFSPGDLQASKGCAAVARFLERLTARQAA